MSSVMTAGKWRTYSHPQADTVEGTVARALGDKDRWRLIRADIYHLIVQDYRDQINAALGGNLYLSGEHFLLSDPHDTDSIPDAIAQALDSVDLWAIVEQHEMNLAIAEEEQQ